MGKTYRVVRVLDPEVASGVNDNGAWARAEVEFDNGWTKQVFQPVRVGDMVESYKNGQYWNYRVVNADQAASVQTQQSQPTPKKTYKKSYNSNSSKNQNAIRAQWAIGRATDLCASGQIGFDDIESAAHDFFAMADRVEQGTSIEGETVKLDEDASKLFGDK